MNKEALTYNDVLLVPQYSDIRSRVEVSLTSKLGHLQLDLPIIASPMDTITETQMATNMSTLGGLGIIHRYNRVAQQANMVAAVEGVGERVGTVWGRHDV